MRERLAAAFAKRDDPYAGADLGNASRFGGALWFLGAIFTLALLPIIPPDDAIGGAGWAVAGAVIVGGVVIGQRMRTMGTHVNVDELLLYSYAAIASIALLVWISGGIDSPYAQLFLVSAIYTSAVHPPRRAGAYLVVLSILVLLPLAYDDATKRDTVDLVSQLVIILVIALVTLLLMTYVRAQRVGLRLEGETARRQARLDQLTGLLNRRAFDEDLASAIERARATGDPLSVLIGDLDDFKDYNDRCGHLEGDRVLRVAAEALPPALRRPDLAYRWGGDEFAVILPQADFAGAALVARRVEEAIAGNTGPSGGSVSMTTGVAEFREGQQAADLVAAADQALMLAKGSGAFDAPHAHG